MGFQFTPYIVFMLSAAVVCFLIGFNAWRRRDTPVDTMIIFIMMMAITEWLVASALGFATTDPASKITWAKIEYIGVVSVPLMVLIFAVNYSGLKQRLTSRNLILFALVPAITLLLAWTNEMHGLIWSRYIPYQENGLMFSNKTYGPGFWVYWIYSYLLLLAATVLIIRTALFSGKAFRGQAAVLTIGIILPWLGNAIYVLHISPLGNLDLTPLAFAFTGSMLALGVVRWHLFDIKPTAHVAVIENMADGLILLNNRDRIIDINPAALHIFRVSSLKTIGKQGPQILPDELFSDELRDSDGKIRLEMKLTDNGRARHYEITGTPFYDRLGDLTGRIIIVHDVTELKLAQEMLHIAERKQADNALEQSEEKYRTLFEKVGEGILIANRETRKFRYANPAICKMLGYSQDELIGMGVNDIHPEDALDNVIHEFEALIKGEKILTSHIPCQKKDGTVIYADIRSAQASINGEECNIGFFIDITERKQAEDSLQKSEAQYRLLAEHMTDFIWLMDMNLKLTYQSPSAEKLTGFTQQELMELPFEKRVTPGSLKLAAEVFLEEIPRVMADPDYNPIMALELEICRRDGTTLWSENKFSVIRDEKGQPVSILGEARDITEHKKAAEALRSKQIMLSRTEGIANIGSWEWDIATDTVTWSDELFRIFQRDPQAGAPSFAEHPALYHPDDMALLWQAVEAAVADGTPYALELRAIRKDGETRVCIGRGVAEMGPGGRPVRLVGSFQDITERKHAEEALWVSEMKYRTLFESFPLGITISDSAGNVIESNKESERLLGLSKEEHGKRQIDGKEWRMIRPDGSPMPADEYASVKALKENQNVGNQESGILKGDNDVTWINVTAAPIPLEGYGVVITYSDITQSKLIQEKLMKSEELLTEAQGVVHIGHWELDLATMIPSWSEEIFRIFGIDPATGEPSFAAHRDLIHPEDWDILNNAVSATSTIGAPFEIEFRLLHPLKGVRWMLAIGRAIRNDKGDISRLYGTAQDITNHKSTQENLEKSRQELRNLSVHLISLREEERTLLAREIHDELGQALTALKMDLSWLSKKLPDGQRPLAEKTASMLKLVDTTVKSVKRLSTELRPGLLDDLGLAAALEWQTGEFQERTGIKTKLSFEPDDITVDDEQATALFRIFQEVLTNIIRHAAATRVDVYLHEKDGLLELSVRDNGKGI